MVLHRTVQMLNQYNTKITAAYINRCGDYYGYWSLDV